MHVEFIRSGERRYGVRIHRDDAPNLVMDPAPGFDADLPHDMVHMVVEAELGLKHGVFGQLAAGGTAGSFHVEAGSGKMDSRTLARERKRVAKKGHAIFRDGRDNDVSEYAAAIFDTLWRSRTSGRAGPPPEVATQITQMRQSLTREEGAAFITAEPRILEQFDRLSAAWHKAPVGKSIMLAWPSLVLQP